MMFQYKLRAPILLAFLLPVAWSGGEELFRNAKFEEAGESSPAGWQRLPGKDGVVQIEREDGVAHVSIKVEERDCFIQQIAPLPGDAARVTLSAEFRWSDIVRGPRGHMEGKLQGRFTKGGDDFGSWIDLGGLEGSSDGWKTATRTVEVPDEADGLMMRVGFYSPKAGRMDVRSVSGVVMTDAEVAVERRQFRPAEEFGPAVSDSRRARLRRGININNWFCQPWNIKVGGTKGGFDERTLTGFITMHDLGMIRNAGFDHIRLATDPVFLMDTETGSLKTDLLPLYDRAIKMILDVGLAVVVDVHPKSTPFSKMKGKPVAERFVGWWEAFARHLSATDPERVFLELLNEPGGQGFWTDGWQPYQDRLLTVIRAAAPKHTLIANGGAYMLVKELENIEPHPDRNVIWSVHYYEPSPFTHQGAQWMKDWYRPLREVPWPLTDERQVEQAIAALAEDKAVDKAADVLKDQLKSGRADVAAMRRHLQQVVDWGNKHRRFMYLGEWGVYTKYAPRESRLRYLAAFTSTTNELGLGWAKWDYCGAGFSVVENPDADSEQRKLDAAVIKALGLQ